TRYNCLERYRFTQARLKASRRETSSWPDSSPGTPRKPRQPAMLPRWRGMGLRGHRQHTGVGDSDASEDADPRLTDFRERIRPSIPFRQQPLER
ncbi:unnamed protein product, partial [Ectocarpus sp. 12 AP-2014]